MSELPPAVELEIARLFRIRRTVLELLRDRGYVVLDSEDDLGMTRSQFRSQFGQDLNRESLTMLKQHTENPTDQIYVFFAASGGKALGVKQIQKYAERMEVDGIPRAIIVLQSKLTSYAMQAVRQLQRYRIEIFLENELLVNITHHELVPLHQVLSEEAKKAVLNRYKLKESQLPRILRSDPIARYYGLVPGNVLKITRPSETAGRYVTYRLCV